MSTAIANRPLPQKWPGGAADGTDCKWDLPAGFNEQSNRYRPVSPETGLEAVPRLPIASVKVADSR